MTSTDGRQGWSLLHRVAFRFASLYFFLYTFPGPFPLPWLPDLIQRTWAALVPWVGRHLLHLAQPAVPHPTGSGDTLFHYVQLLCFALLAAFGTALWSWLDRRRPHYRTLHGGFRIYLRFVLAAAMLGYGFIKVFPSQFKTPDPGTLMEPYGRSSPMHLLWTFMGASQAYTIFSGAGEVLGGLLLLFRRTATLGALIVAAVMANVVSMNFCYDVPVKQYSSHLLAMALFLAMPDLGRLFDLLVRQRAAAAPEPRAPFRKVWMERGALVLKGICVAFLVGSTAYGSYQGWKTWGNAAPKLGLHGLYRVESFAADGRELPPLTTDASRWSKVAIYRQRGLVVQFMDEARVRYALKQDGDPTTLTLIPVPLHPEPPAPGAVPIPVKVASPDAQHLLLEGTFEKRALRVLLRKEDPADYLLLNRGFHWISEYPYNR